MGSRRLPGAQITVVIADQDPMVRGLLAQRLNAEGDFAVLSVEADAENAIAAVTAVKPDILLTDILLPKVSWLHVAVSYRSVSTRPVLMCASFDHKQVLEELYRGSLGVWMKEDMGLLAECLRCVASGGYWNRTHEVFEIGSMIREVEREARDGSVRLTAREQEVMLLTSSGMTVHEISTRLKMREETVKRHLTNMSEKLGISSSSELARFVRESGLGSIAQGGQS